MTATAPAPPVADGSAPKPAVLELRAVAPRVRTHLEVLAYGHALKQPAALGRMPHAEARDLLGSERVDLLPPQPHLPA